MKFFICSAILFSALAAAVPGQAATAPETDAQREARMKWWTEARFGMFIHWGVYAVPAGTYKDKQIPGIDKRLHDYANLYFDAHNPMLSKLRDKNNEICILWVNPKVMDLPGVIIADQNASSKYVRFYPVTEGLVAIDKNKLFAKYWTHPENQYEEWAHKSVKCAEVLVPNKIEPKYITDAYMANPTALEAFKKLNVQLTVSIKTDIFF